MYTADQLARTFEAAGVQIEGASVSEFIVFCPWHSNYRTPAAEINAETGQFYCFSCKHVDDVIGFIQQRTGKTYWQVFRLLNANEQQSDLLDVVEKCLAKPKEPPAFPDDVVERMHNDAMTSPRVRDFWISRGVTKESVIKYRFGYSKKQDMVTMPYRNPLGTAWLGMEARSIVGKRFLAQGPKTQTLFNLSNRTWAPEIYVVESIIDCVRLEQVGAPAVALMGSAIGKTQVSLLNRYFGTVYIVQDNDDQSNGYAGQASAAKLRDKLTRGIIVVPPRDYKDIGEMPDEQIRQLVTSTQDITEGI